MSIKYQEARLAITGISDVETITSMSYVKLASIRFSSEDLIYSDLQRARIADTLFYLVCVKVVQMRSRQKKYLPMYTLRELYEFLQIPPACLNSKAFQGID